MGLAVASAGGTAAGAGGAAGSAGGTVEGAVPVPPRSGHREEPAAPRALVDEGRPQDHLRHGSVGVGAARPDLVNALGVLALAFCLAFVSLLAAALPPTRAGGPGLGALPREVAEAAADEAGDLLVVTFVGLALVLTFGLAAALREEGVHVHVRSASGRVGLGDAPARSAGGAGLVPPVSAELRPPPLRIQEAGKHRAEPAVVVHERVGLELQHGPGSCRGPAQHDCHLDAVGQLVAWVRKVVMPLDLCFPCQPVHLPLRQASLAEGGGQDLLEKADRSNRVLGLVVFDKLPPCLKAVVPRDRPEHLKGSAADCLDENEVQGLCDCLLVRVQLVCRKDHSFRRRHLHGGLQDLVSQQA
jgi:hypothetical protein